MDRGPGEAVRGSGGPAETRGDTRHRGAGAGGGAQGRGSRGEAGNWRHGESGKWRNGETGEEEQERRDGDGGAEKRRNGEPERQRGRPGSAEEGHGSRGHPYFGLPLGAPFRAASRPGWRRAQGVSTNMADQPPGSINSRRPAGCAGGSSDASAPQRSAESRQKLTRYQGEPQQWPPLQGHQ